MLIESCLTYICCIANSTSPLPDCSPEKLAKLAVGKEFFFPDNSYIVFKDNKLQLHTPDRELIKVWTDNPGLIIIIQNELNTLRRKASRPRLSLVDA